MPRRLALLRASLALSLLLVLDLAALRLALRALLRRLLRLARGVVAPRAARHLLSLRVRPLLLGQRASPALEPVVRLLPLVVVHHAVARGPAVDVGGDALEVFAKRRKLLVEDFLLRLRPRPHEFQSLLLRERVLDERVPRAKR